MSNEQAKLERPASIAYNSAVVEAASAFPQVRLFTMDSVIYEDADRLVGFDHFKRGVYFRLYEALLAELQTDCKGDAASRSAA